MCLASPQGQFRLPVLSTSCRWSNFTTQPWNGLASSSGSDTQHWITDARPHAHTTPRKMLTQSQHVVPRRGAGRNLHYFRTKSEAISKWKYVESQFWKKMAQLSSAIFPAPPSSLLSLLMGTEGTDGESSSPYCLPRHCSPPPPFPDVCVLIILVSWLALPLCLLTAPFISI